MIKPIGEIRRPVAAGVPPAVKGGIWPFGWTSEAAARMTSEHAAFAGQDARLHGRRDARRYRQAVEALDTALRDGSRAVRWGERNREFPMSFGLAGRTFLSVGKPELSRGLPSLPNVPVVRLSFVALAGGLRR